MKRRNPGEELRQQLQLRADPSARLRAVAANNPDSQISKALFNLSFEDRSEINEEIHGASCRAPEETPELLEVSLKNFHIELPKIEYKPAYDRACELLVSNPSGNPEPYIHTNCYKLSFLRCELFDACKAAKRYTKYLNVLLEIYGEKALQRPIRMTDLDKEDLSYLREGQVQVLPLRDRSGRRIVCLAANTLKEFPKRVLLKVYIYMYGGVFTNNDVGHLESQRKGVVVIVIPGHKVLGNDTMRDLERRLSWIISRGKINDFVGSIIPMRIVAAHICLPEDAITRTLTSVYTMILSSWLPKVKFHFGNALELRYKLQGYGIPIELIPSTDTGNIKSANLKQWIKLRRYLEWHVQQQETNFYSSESESASDYESSISNMTYPSHIVECPGSNDVIFRRGKSMNYHPGNVKFLNLIESDIQEHTFDAKTTQTRRMAIEKGIIRKVREGGGRFLTWEIENCWWVDMSKGNYKGNCEIDKEIQRKIHYAFRDFRKKLLKTQQNLIFNNSSTYAFECQDGQKRKRYYNDGTRTSNVCNAGDRCFPGGFESLPDA